MDLRCCDVAVPAPILDDWEAAMFHHIERGPFAHGPGEGALISLGRSIAHV